MHVKTFLHTQLWSQLFSSLVILLLLTDIVTGSPFLPRPVANQFLSSADTSRAKRARSVRTSGQTDTGLMELEGWQEIVKRTADTAPIPTPRLRTLEKLRSVRQQVRHLLDDVDTISAQVEVGGVGRQNTQDLLHGNYGNTGSRNHGDTNLLQGGSHSDHGNRQTNGNHGDTITEHSNYDNTVRPERRQVDGGSSQETLENLRVQLQALERSDYKEDPGAGLWQD